MGPTSESRRFDHLADILRGFFRVSGVRAMAIETAAEDRRPVSALIAGFEHHADNRAPLYPLRVAGCDVAERAWTEISRSLQECHTNLRGAGAPVGPMPALRTGREAAARASVLMADLAAGIEPPASGILVSLDLANPIAPALLKQMSTILRSRELADARFIVLAGPEAKLEPWTARLGEDTIWFYRLEPATSAEATRTLQELDAEEAHGPGFRGAWPMGVKPPPRPRRRRPGAVAAEGGDEAQIEEVLAPDEQARFEHQLSLLVRRAEAQMQQGRGPEALRVQTQARELCTEHDQHVRAIDMQMMLGGYLLRLDQPRLAAASFTRADEAGFEHQAFEHAAKAQLNAGIAYEADGDIVAALRSYRRTIETGKGVADAPSVVLEAYRRAGEAALREDLEGDCVGLWGDAVAYARDLPAQRRGESVKEIAKRLSALLTRHRRYSQAREIDRIAAEF